MEGLKTLFEEAKELAICVQNAKNLVIDGKIVHADRKLQSALTRCNRVLRLIVEMPGGTELVNQSMPPVAEDCPKSPVSECSGT